VRLTVRAVATMEKAPLEKQDSTEVRV
jgi:hypothetical protein